MRESKKKIAIFHCGFIYSGGGERIVLEEAKALLKKGYLVEVFAPTLDKKICFPQEIEDLGVKTFFPQLPSFFPAHHALLMVFSSIFAPLLFYKFKDVDIFIGENQPGIWLAYCIAKILKKPYIAYMNQPNRLLYYRKIDKEVNWQNLKEYYFIDNLIKRARFFVKWADTKSVTQAKKILVNGGYIEKVIKNVYKIKTILCPAGAVLNSEKLLLSSDKAYMGSFRIKNLEEKEFKIQRPYILLTNRHVPQKKFEYAIKSLAILLKEKKFRELQLIIPSNLTDYSFVLMAQAKKLNVDKNIIFTGQIKEQTLQYLYKNAAVYVYTSPEEDFGMGIIEAMGWGIPVVAWNRAGPTVTVKHKQTGFLAKPYHILDFADKIRLVLNNKKLRARLGRNAWRRVRDNFSWEIHNRILEKTILDTL